MISDDRPYRDSYQFVRRISFTQVSNAFYLGSPRVYVGGKCVEDLDTCHICHKPNAPLDAG
jgi:hypothetical protein